VLHAKENVALARQADSAERGEAEKDNQENPAQSRAGNKHRRGGLPAKMSDPIQIDAEGKYLFVTVTWEHIENGERHAHRCPVTNATKESHEDADYVLADGMFITFGFDHGMRCQRVKTPPQVARFIHWFDKKPHRMLDRIKRWWYVRPFTFFLDITK
jgi:hypothetical protein